MKNSTIILLVLTIVASSCATRSSKTIDYDRYANRHNLIAVLPYDLIYSGRVVESMDPYELEEVKMTESKIFQQHLHATVMRKTGRGSKDIQVSVQPLGKTRSLLADNGINALNISEIAPSQLGEILGVDAVVSTRLSLKKFLTREEGVAVRLVTDALGDVADLPVGVARSLSRTEKIDAFCTIIDARDDVTIWTFNTELEIDFSQDTDEIVENINSKIARRFPYR